MKQFNLMESLTKSDVKAIELSVKFLLDDISEELRVYEESGIDDAAETSREMVSELYKVLGKVRNMSSDVKSA